MSKQFYITTAIDYINGRPHLGHAYEKIITDVIARAKESEGESVFYLTGTDEHGQKVNQAAQDDGKSTSEFCDLLAEEWREFSKILKLCNNDFIRTTEPRHTRTVQAVLNRLKEANELYKDSYHGFYSTKEETFLTDRDRGPDGEFDPMYGEVVELIEENYYFRLADQQDWLIEHIESNPDFITPSYRKNEVLGFLKNNKLEDLCITRPAERLNWGIPLPFDKDYVTYVWFDALINYITVPAAHGDATVLDALQIDPLESERGKTSLWPADVQVIGKDIIKFHAVFWPIMLKKLGLPLPKKILVHGWWQKDGQKMSKTTGNVVDPIQVIKDSGLDAFRYYVTRELDIGPDGNWTDAGFDARYQAELANGLGNLVNRSLSMLNRYRKGIVPPRSEDLKEDAENCIKAVRNALTEYRLQEGLKHIWKLIDRTNQYVDQTAPFTLAKDPDKAERLGETLFNLVEICRILGAMVEPFIPETSSKIYRQLNREKSTSGTKNLAWSDWPEAHQISKQEPLFPRKDK
ncbi:MAG TPA: methionine--tRNA ligase [Verrucomicrobiales bacterium]|nr:methionine--tRNA ligase [Verrucomicrobiales bacterium]